MNKSKAQHIIDSLKKKKIGAGTDLQISVSTTDMSVMAIIILLSLLFTSIIGLIDSSESSPFKVFRYALLIITSPLLIHSFYKYAKLKRLRDFILSYKVQNIDEINK